MVFPKRDCAVERRFTQLASYNAFEREEAASGGSSRRC